jgi:CheY-like chemotaxis protein
LSGPKGISRPAGVDGHLERPTDLPSARRLVEICVRAKIPTRVLVVDDSGTMRSIVRKILACCPFTLEVHEASEGIEALNQLRACHFGIVFVDYNMPGLNGFDMLMPIKREIPSVTVVMMSSTLRTQHRRKGVRQRRARFPEEAVFSGRHQCSA